MCAGYGEASREHIDDTSWWQHQALCALEVDACSVGQDHGEQHSVGIAHWSESVVAFEGALPLRARERRPLICDMPLLGAPGRGSALTFSVAECDDEVLVSDGAVLPTLGFHNGGTSLVVLLISLGRQVAKRETSEQIVLWMAALVGYLDVMLQAWVFKSGKMLRHGCVDHDALMERLNELGLGLHVRGRIGQVRL